jgi:hypothetical protein
MLLDTHNSHELVAVYLYVEMLKVPYTQTLDYNVEYFNINTNYYVKLYVKENEDNNNISIVLTVKGYDESSYTYTNDNLFFDDGYVIKWIAQCLVAYEQKHIEEIKKNWYE